VASLENVGFADWRHHAWNMAVRPRLAAQGLAKRWSVQDDRPK
jgi:hypothetical protein